MQKENIFARKVVASEEIGNLEKPDGDGRNVFGKVRNKTFKQFVSFISDIDVNE